MPSGVRQPAIDRFWQFVEPEPNTGCWLWSGAINTSGYGELKVARHQVEAHRFAYEYYRGPIPLNLESDRLCRTRSCANPWHIEPVTRHENWLRGESFTRVQARRDTCSRGHLFDLIRPNGGRDCSICRQERNRRAQERLVADPVRLAARYEWHNAYRRKRNARALVAAVGN